MKDDIGDRMKGYEKVQTRVILDENLPIYARIDGRGFSKFTKGMNKPFDDNMTDCMIHTAEAVMTATHARAAFVQSDEISLFWHKDKPETQALFGGRIQKLSSVLAGLATVHFGNIAREKLDEKYIARNPHFDARIFNLPNEDELTNAFLWRFKDAHRNAVQMVGQAFFSHKELQGKSTKEVVSMLDDISQPMENWRARNRNGVFIVKQLVDSVVDTPKGVVNVTRSKNTKLSPVFDYLDHDSRKALLYKGLPD